MKKVLSVLGTRPEVIKLAPVIQRLQKQTNISSYICATTQHREMQDSMLALFNLKQDIDLDIMRPNQDLFYLTSELLVRLKKAYQDISPDLILVHGDTTTSFVATLAAFYLQIPVGHVEAGLRSHNLKAPFPEEANRTLTGRLAAMHFAPTLTARRHLEEESISKNVFVTGNTVIDALMWMRNQLKNNLTQIKLPDAIQAIINQKQRFVLITGHRRENFGEGFMNICHSIKTLSEQFPDVHFVYPVHLNPNVQAPVYKLLSKLSNVHLIEPVDYADFVFLLSHCHIVLTDSGGLQEEAPALGKPVLVMREVTERPEGISAGTAKLVGTDKNTIVEVVSNLLKDQAVYSAMANAINPYGDGSASERIVNIIECFFDDRHAEAQQWNWCAEQMRSPA